MKQELVAKIRFSPELQDIWPKTVLTAEAHLNDSNKDAVPWSMRAELWNSPNEDGIAWAWISFLSPKAPFAELPPLKPFKLTRGNTVVAHCTICTDFVQSQSGMQQTENDFVNNPHNSIRKAA